MGLATDTGIKGASMCEYIVINSRVMRLNHIHVKEGFEPVASALLGHVAVADTLQAVADAFQSGDVLLTGTLSKPSTPGPHPAVVILPLFALALACC